jgi:hypothetical protein
VAGGYLSFNTQNNATPFPLVGIIGPGSIYIRSNDDIKNTYFNFAPYIGKEVSFRWLLGIQLGYAMERYKAFDVEIFGQPYTVDIRQNENQYGIGVFGRYLINPENKFMAFIQPYLNYTYASEANFQDETQTGGRNTNAFSLGTSAGVLYDISEHFRITTRIGLLGFTAGHWQDTETDESSDFNSFATTLNFSSLSFGFEYKF